MHKKAFWLVMIGAWLCLSAAYAPALALQGTVRVVTTRDDVNIRIIPAIGAEVIAFAQAGSAFTATGRSPDDQWVRIDFAGEEAWIGVPVLSFLEGSIGDLPVADPRTIPFGGFESPRSGRTSADSPIRGTLPDSGLRVRAGPGIAYPVLANAPRFTEFPLLGRTASNGWVQVNFEGTLGWVKAEFVQIQANASILDLPVNGIVAEELPLVPGGDDEYFTVLRLMRERLDLAQGSLDEMRRRWTDAALGTAPFCGGYPARPTGFNIPNQLLAQYFVTLDPILEDFNEAMAGVRFVIDLQIDTCNRPGPEFALTSAPVVTAALEEINETDRLFASLRDRLDLLLPELGPNDCVFSYVGIVEILQLIPVGEVILDSFTGRRAIEGYCFDANEGDVLNVEVQRLNGNFNPLISVSPLNNPTNFIGTGASGNAEGKLRVGPLNILETGRYLIVVSDNTGAERPADQAPEGDYALFVTGTQTLTVDENNELIITEFSGFFGGGFDDAEVVGGETTDTGGSVVTAGDIPCPGTDFTCNQLFTCAEAQACLSAGNTSLDPDANGRACEGQPLNC